MHRTAVLGLIVMGLAAQAASASTHIPVRAIPRFGIAAIEMGASGMGNTRMLTGMAGAIAGVRPTPVSTTLWAVTTALAQRDAPVSSEKPAVSPTIRWWGSVSELPAAAPAVTAPIVSFDLVSKLGDVITEARETVKAVASFLASTPLYSAGRYGCAIGGTPESAAPVDASPEPAPAPKPHVLVLY